MKATRFFYAITPALCLTLACATAHAQSIRLDDRRINDEDYGTDARTQQLPDIASSRGGFTAVWQETGGDFMTHVIARRFDESGRPISPSVRVNDDTTMESGFTTPRVARSFPNGVIGDPDGRSVVVWNNLPAGALGGSIVAQLFDDDGARIGGNVVVDPASVGEQYEPVVAMNPTGAGNFLVAWSDRRDYSDIFLRRFDNNGSPSGPSLRVNADTSRMTRSRPAIATAGELGGFVVVWQESDGFTNGIRRLVGNLYDGSGRVIRGGFRVDSLLPNGYAPSVAMAGDGSFVVAFESVARGQQDLFVRRYTAAGIAEGDLVSIEDVDGGNQRAADISLLAGSNGFAITFEEVQPNEPDGEIYIQAFDERNTPRGAAVQLNIPAGTAQGNCALAVVGYGGTNPQETRAFALWQDARTGDPDIWGVTLDDFVINGQNARINESTLGGADQTRSAIDATWSGMQVVAWDDAREDDVAHQVYAKRLSRDGSSLGADIRISDESGTLIRLEPDVAVRSDSSFIVVWRSARRGPAGDIVLRMLDASGNNLVDESLVHDTGSIVVHDVPAIASAPGGSFVVVWREGDGDASSIVARRFGSDGAPLAASFRVDSDTVRGAHGAPAVAFYLNGGFVVVWDDERDGDRDIWAQTYDTSGTPLGGNRQVNVVTSTEENTPQISPAVAIAPNGEGMIAWLDYDEVSRRADVTARRFDRDGMIGASFRVSDRNGAARPFCLECIEEPPSIAAAKGARATDGDNSFVVAWTDYRDSESEPRVRAQFYEGSRAIGGNIVVGDRPVGRAPDVARDGISTNGIYLVWEDDRMVGSEGWSVWGSIYDWTMGTASVESTTASTGVSVHPNPFASQTSFSFTLDRSSHVSLRVYSLQGELVASIVDGALEAGDHLARWNDGDLSAGAYLYRLVVDGTICSGVLTVR